VVIQNAECSLLVIPFPPRSRTVPPRHNTVFCNLFKFFLNIQTFLEVWQRYSWHWKEIRHAFSKCHSYSRKRIEEDAGPLGERKRLSDGKRIEPRVLFVISCDNGTILMHSLWIGSRVIDSASIGIRLDLFCFSFRGTFLRWVKFPDWYDASEQKELTRTRRNIIDRRKARMSDYPLRTL